MENHLSEKPVADFIASVDMPISKEDNKKDKQKQLTEKEFVVLSDEEDFEISPSRNQEEGCKFLKSHSSEPNEKENAVSETSAISFNESGKEISKVNKVLKKKVFEFQVSRRNASLQGFWSASKAHKEGAAKENVKRKQLDLSYFIPGVKPALPSEHGDSGQKVITPFILSSHIFFVLYCVCDFPTAYPRSLLIIGGQACSAKEDS